jgi:hypothetical protein
LVAALRVHVVVLAGRGHAHGGLACRLVGKIKVFVADNRIGTGRQGRASHYLDGRLWVAQWLGRRAGQLRALDGEGSVARCQRREAEGDAVHRHAVVGREVAVSSYLLAQYAAHGGG